MFTRKGGLQRRLGDLRARERVPPWASLDLGSRTPQLSQHPRLRAGHPTDHDRADSGSPQETAATIHGWTPFVPACILS